MRQSESTLIIITEGIQYKLQENQVKSFNITLDDTYSIMRELRTVDPELLLRSTFDLSN